MKTSSLGEHAPTSRRLLHLIRIKRDADKLIEEGMDARRAVAVAVDRANVVAEDRGKTEWIVHTAITDPMHGAI